MAISHNLQVSNWLVQASQECYDQLLSKKYKQTNFERFPEKGSINGVVVQRPNHGLANAIRKISFIPLVVALFEQGGISGYKINGTLISLRGEIENMQIATLFSVAGRESEISHKDDPANYAQFRKTSSELYEAHIRANKDLNPAYQQLVKTDLVTFYKRIIFSPYGDDKCIISRIFRIVHCLDLQRCYTRVEFGAAIEAIRYDLNPLSQSSAILMAHTDSLKEYATQCLAATGDQNLSAGIGRNLELFVICSTIAKTCFDQIKKVNVPTFAITQSQPTLSKIDSSRLIPLKGLVRREDFARASANKMWELQKVFISKSDFVPRKFVEHQMRNKKNNSLGVKYVPGDKITPMEGALYTFVTPICAITLSGDPTYIGRHTISPFQNKGRRVVLSAAIQPDFELSGDNEVMMKIVEIKDQALMGASLDEDASPLWRLSQGQNDFAQKLPQYDKALQQHMVYHLTKEHRLPSLDQVKGHTLTEQAAKELIERLIKGGNENDPLTNRFVQLNGHVISLEVLFNTYKNQLANEFSILEKELTQGYVYTVDPPSTVAQQIGKTTGVEILNRIQVLAFKHLRKNMALDNLKIIGFNSYLDPTCLDLFKAVFPEKGVVPKTALFKDGYYAEERPYALVLHNNSDGFGQNFKTEGPTSLGGVISTFSDTSSQLDNDRPDLVDFTLLSTTTENDPLGGRLK